MIVEFGLVYGFCGLGMIVYGFGVCFLVLLFANLLFAGFGFVRLCGVYLGMYLLVGLRFCFVCWLLWVISAGFSGKGPLVGFVLFVF